MIGAIKITCNRKESARVIELIEANPGMQVYVQDLDVGDFIIGERVILKRMTDAEFVAASVNRKLYSEIGLMLERYDRVIMIIEGNPLATRAYVEPESLIDTLAWLAVLSEVQTVISDSESHSACLIATMARYQQHGLGYQLPLRHSAPAAAPSVLTRYILEGLPGVTTSTANILAKRFLNLHGLANATLEELQDTRGIGISLGSKIYKALRVGEGCQCASDQSNCGVGGEVDGGVPNTVPV